MAASVPNPDDVIGLTNPITRKSVDATVLETELEKGRRDSVLTLHAIPIGTEEPTEEERTTLRKVPGSIPIIAFTLCFIELAERASYYGVKGVFNNYMEYPLPPNSPGNTGAIDVNGPDGLDQPAGALNQGLQFASALGNVFVFLSYLLPIFGAWIADAKIGRYQAIMWGVIIGGIAHVIMIGGAAPALLAAGKGVAPFLISLVLLAIGAGIFKPNVAPLLVEQYRYQKQYVKVLGSGERVIVDPEITIQRIFLWFYAFINIGGFFAIATTYAEKYLGFWIAYLLPGIVYFLLPIVLMLINKKLIKKPAVGSELPKFFKVIWTAVRQNNFKPWGKDYFAKAQPAYLAERGINANWDAKFVKDVARTLVACQIFLYFPIYNINDGGVGAVQSNQGGSMILGTAPNDLLNNFNPLVIIILTPFLSHGLYPFLNNRGIKFGRISRMTFGFILCALSGVAGAIVQYYVYETSPCGYEASTCDNPSTISIWWQMPNVILGAISELFCNVTAYEMAYARSPDNMKSMVMAMFLFTNALSALLGIILTPVIVDPTLIWAWAGPAIALFAQTVVFWIRHRGVNDDEFMTNADYEAETAEHAVPEVGVKSLETEAHDFGSEKKL